MKTVLIEVNENHSSFTTYFKKENQAIYKWAIHHLSKLSEIKNSYIQNNIEVTLVFVRD